MAFLGDKGTLIVDDKGWRVEQGDGAKGERARKDRPHHVQNFLDCVKSRQRPNADIEIGHLSTRLCLLGNIAHRTAKKLTFDAASESFHDAAADALLAASTVAGSRCLRTFEPETFRRQRDPPRLEPRRNMQLSPIGLTVDELDTPALLLDLDALEHNVDQDGGPLSRARRAVAASRQGVQVPGDRSHPAQPGAIGVTVAKVSEAEVMAAGGITDILIATWWSAPARRRGSPPCRNRPTSRSRSIIPTTWLN